MLMATDVSLLPPGGVRPQWSISLLALVQVAATALSLASVPMQRVTGAQFLP